LLGNEDQSPDTPISRLECDNVHKIVRRASSRALRMVVTFSQNKIMFGHDQLWVPRQTNSHQDAARVLPTPVAIARQKNVDPMKRLTLSVRQPLTDAPSVEQSFSQAVYSLLPAHYVYTEPLEYETRTSIAARESNLNDSPSSSNASLLYSEEPGYSNSDSDSSSISIRQQASSVQPPEPPVEKCRIEAGDDQKRLHAQSVLAIDTVTVPRALKIIDRKKRAFCTRRPLLTAWDVSTVVAKTVPDSEKRVGSVLAAVWDEKASPMGRDDY